MNNKFTLLIIILFGYFGVKAGTTVDQYDVCVFGATPSGISAAVNAAKLGVNVLLIEESDHIGGLMTGGMSNPDFKTFEAVNGFYKDFMNRVQHYYKAKYGAESRQVKDCYHGVWYEPKVARDIFFNMLSEHENITVIKKLQLQSVVVKVDKPYRRLTSILYIDEFSQNHVVKASVFIDATYEGDLMAKVGVPYEIGRESRSEYGELYAGVKYYSGGKFLMGSTGEGDHRIQCYNFRLCLTDNPELRVPVSKPEGYSRGEFLPLLALLKEGEIEKFDGGLVGINRIPNGKSDVNDLMYSHYSLRLPGENYKWPDGDKSTRKAIFERHKNYTLGFLYFLQNDPEVPLKIRQEAADWGFASDEFVDYDHFSPVLYVREARRMKGDFVLTEKDLLPHRELGNGVRSPLYTSSIAICDYSMDSHGNAPPTAWHPNITEGVFNAFVVPYQLPFEVMLPPNIDGLLVTCAVSASHVAFSSLRMEPTWAALGQAAGIAAALGVLEDMTLRTIDVSVVQKELYNQDAMTVYISDVAPESEIFEAAQYFGTRGLFHELPEYEDVPFIGRGKKGGLPGQFILAYPYHEVHPGWPIEKELAESWMQKSKIELPLGPLLEKNATRGEFLLKMYTKVAK